MRDLDIAKQYLDAWNAHDTGAIVKTFASEAMRKFWAELGVQAAAT